MNCKIFGCVNDSSEGRFIGSLCMPCYTYLRHGQGKTSQAYRNEKQLKDLNREIKLKTQRELVK